jgi:hypothetical protein
VKAWPSVDRERLAAAVVALAGRESGPDSSAQLHALAALVRNLGRETGDADARLELEQRVDAALEAGDESAALRTARELTALDRAAVVPVDWTAASGG